jgi:hypothetical protein
VESGCGARVFWVKGSVIGVGGAFQTSAQTTARPWFIVIIKNTPK